MPNPSGRRPPCPPPRSWRSTVSITGRIVTKVEFLQPGGSVKDRAAKAILMAARQDGRLRPGMPVVEMTSGNMGAGLAVVCAALGHPFVATMSAGNSPARARMMEGLGARVVLVPQVDGTPGQVTGPDVAAAAEEAAQIAHEAGTGPEILAQCDQAVTGWVATVGTGCTFLGVARALKAANPATLCVAVEPEGSAPLAGQPIIKPRHIVQGTGYSLIPPHWDAGLMDLGLTDTEDWHHRLATREGPYVGYSAAANVCAAAKLLVSGRLGPDATVATVLCDTGLKY